jgi:hypothetical protein
MGPSTICSKRREFCVKNTRVDGTRPLARVEEVVVTEAGDELMVYDKRVHALHTLDPFAKIIWQNCDGSRDVKSIQAICCAELANSVSEQDVEEGLAKLADAGLLQGWQPDRRRATGRTSRRKMLKRTTVAGAAVASVTMPLATAHASSGSLGTVPNGGTCTTAEECVNPGVGCFPPFRGAQPTCGGI